MSCTATCIEHFVHVIKNFQWENSLIADTEPVKCFLFFLASVGQFFLYNYRPVYHQSLNHLSIEAKKINI